MDFRKDIIRVLKKVELLNCLNLQQKQRLADLLSEEVTFVSPIILVVVLSLLMAVH